jgi:sortase A
MRDKRPVDELSIEELERILAIRKREARLDRMRRYEGTGRVIGPGEQTIEPAPIPSVPEPKKVDPEPESAKPGPQPIPQVYYEDDPRFEDDFDFEYKKKSTPDGKSPMVKVWNTLLVMVEIAAVFGLIALFVGLFQSFQAVTQASANIQAEYQATANARLIPPTATPVIMISDVVLPVGHTVNVNANGVVVNASFNLDEVPAQFRAQYNAMLTQPMMQPTASPDGPVRVQIQKLGVDSAVLAGDSWNVLQLGVGHHIGSANPGQRGNMVLSAHNDVYGEIFRYLDKLEPGDMVTVSTTTKDFTYIVQGRQIVNPTDVWVLESRGQDKQLTLISCYPYRVDNKRIVVFASLQS